MDPSQDLLFAAEKLRETVARVLALSMPTQIPGVEDALKPLADQIEALADQFKPPPMPEIESFPNVGDDLVDTGTATPPTLDEFLVEPGKAS